MNRVKIILEDIEQSMEYKFLETASDKKEIEKIAAKRGLIVPSPDIALFKGTYTRANVFNNNGSRIKRKELAKALDTLILKPVTHNHEEKEVIGVWLDAKLEGDVVTAYGAIYKDNFKREYAKFKNDFERGDIGISYEIYGDKIKVADGKYDWENIFFCGGALLDRGIRPAVHGSKVFEFAKEKEIGVGDVNLTLCNKCNFKFDASTVKPEENGAIKCPGCKEVLGINQPTQSTNEIPCDCPNCGNHAWDNLYDHEDKTIASCTSCQMKYEIEIEEYNKNKINYGVNIAHEGTVNCYQCKSLIKYPIFANKKETSLICRDCGLSFIHKRKIKEFKYIVKSIKEFKEENMNELQKAFASVEKVEDVTDELIKIFETASEEDKAALDSKVKEIAEEVIRTNKETAANEKDKQEKEVAYKDLLKQGIKKLATEIMNLREDVKIVGYYERELASTKEGHTKEIAKVVEEKEKEIAKVKEDYKEEARTIYNRKQELGSYSEAMSDEQILDERDYKIAKLEKELAVKKTKEGASHKPSIILGSEDDKVLTGKEKETAEYNKRLVKEHEKVVSYKKK